jgi:ferric-dicitrate binding protein FerR (iron transport regulator)
MNKNRQDIDELLLLQYLQGNLDNEQRSEVEAWLEADGGNRKHLDSLESLWLETGRISPAPVAVDVSAAWGRISERIAKEEGHTAGKRVRMPYYRFLMGAAATILVLAGLYGFYRLVISPVKQVQMFSGATVKRDTLPDGSEVTLNSHSTLVYSSNYQKGRRDVKLTGEAYFEVTKDAAHPFVVDAGPASVKVLGTSFRVKTDGGKGIEVTVAEGQVMLFTVDKNTGDTASVKLNAGEAGYLRPGSNQPVLDSTAVADGLFWANHALDFRSMALSEVFTILKKHYQVNITVSDPAMNGCRLTASFQDEPADRILQVIAGSFGWELQVSGNEFHLTGHGCSN